MSCITQPCQIITKSHKQPAPNPCFHDIFPANKREGAETGSRRACRAWHGYCYCPPTTATHCLAERCRGQPPVQTENPATPPGTGSAILNATGLPTHRSKAPCRCPPPGTYFILIHANYNETLMCMCCLTIVCITKVESLWEATAASPCGTPLVLCSS